MQESLHSSGLCSARGRWTCEVHGLFVPLLSQRGREEAARLSFRKRQGLFPDILLQSTEGLEALYEVKVINAGRSRYAIVSGARAQAVERCAAAIFGEYEAMPRTIDERFADEKNWPAADG